MPVTVAQPTSTFCNRPFRDAERSGSVLVTWFVKSPTGSASLSAATIIVSCPV
jgi:hypothetical protein